MRLSWDGHFYSRFLLTQLARIWSLFGFIKKRFVTICLFQHIYIYIYIYIYGGRVLINDPQKKIKMLKLINFFNVHILKLKDIILLSKIIVRI